VSLAKVWEENQHLFRSIAYAITNNSADIDDVLQETYRRVLQSSVTITDAREAFFYLKKSVRNTAIDWNRRTFRRNLTVKEQLPDYQRLEELRSTGENPLSSLLRLERVRTDEALIREITLAVEQLPLKHRQAVSAFFSLDGTLPAKEFCQAHRIPYSTLRSRMLRGIDMIRDTLARKNIPGFVRNQSGTLLVSGEERAVK